MMQILSLNLQGRTDYNHVHRADGDQEFSKGGSTVSFFCFVDQLIVDFVG
jgi:hypothetical protein